MGVASELLAAMTPPASNPIRTYVLTGAVAAITATGAWYGAGVKSRQEYKQVRGHCYACLHTAVLTMDRNDVRFWKPPLLSG